MLRGRYTKVLLIAAIALLLLITVIVIHSTRGTNSEIEEVWRVQIPGASLMTSGDVPSSIQAYGSDAIIASYSSDTLRVFDLKGLLVWEFSESIYRPGFSSSYVMGYCIGSDGSLYIGTHKNYIYAIKPDYSLDWLAKVPGSKRDWSCQPLVAADGTVYAFADIGQLYAFSKDGAKLWQREIPGVRAVKRPIITPDATLYATTDDLRLVAVAPNGDEKWRTAQDADSIYPLSLAPNGTVICPDPLDGVINAFNPDGTLCWSVNRGNEFIFGGEGVVAVAPDSSCYYSEELSNGDGRLVALDANGNQLWDYKTPAGLSDPILLPDGRIVCLAMNLARVAPGVTGTISSWLAGLTGQEKASLLVLNPDGSVDSRIKLDSLFTLAPLTLNPAGDVLLLDEQGILHCFRP
jgi:outer membrane protein assembly factor BamB